MENKLSRLFEFQRFEKNARLAELISETENRYGRELSDEELSFVNAAGETDGMADNRLDPNRTQRSENY